MKITPLQTETIEMWMRLHARPLKYDKETRISVPIQCYLLEHNHKKILFDAGQKPLNRIQDPLEDYVVKVKEEEFTVNLLKDMGITEDDLDCIILSHAHEDHFASLTLREKDLLFLSRNELYAPFCKALIALKNGDKKRTCDLLETADAKENIPLLFFAARILGENGRNQAALDKYALFPAASPYRIAVLLNKAELFAENGDSAKALASSRQAYEIAPDIPEVQLCYAEKLYKAGKLTLIPDVLILASGQKYRQHYGWRGCRNVSNRVTPILKKRRFGSFAASCWRLMEITLLLLTHCRNLIINNKGSQISPAAPPPPSGKSFI